MDKMMSMMEKYQKNLEDIDEERTNGWEKENGGFSTTHVAKVRIKTYLKHTFAFTTTSM